jgi:hypothetical protein
MATAAGTLEVFIADLPSIPIIYMEYRPVSALAGVPSPDPTV